MHLSGEKLAVATETGILKTPARTANTWRAADMPTCVQFARVGEWVDCEVGWPQLRGPQFSYLDVTHLPTRMLSDPCDQQCECRTLLPYVVL